MTNHAGNSFDLKDPLCYSVFVNEPRQTTKRLKVGRGKRRMSISRLRKLREQKSKRAVVKDAEMALAKAESTAFAVLSESALRSIFEEDFPHLSFDLKCVSSRAAGAPRVAIFVQNIFWMGLTCEDVFQVVYLAGHSQLPEWIESRRKRISNDVDAFMRKAVRQYRNSVSLMLPTHQRVMVTGCLPALSSHGVPDSVQWVFSDGSALVAPVSPVDVSATLVSNALSARRDTSDLLDILEAM